MFSRCARRRKKRKSPRRGPRASGGVARDPDLVLVAIAREGDDADEGSGDLAGLARALQLHRAVAALQLFHQAGNDLAALLALRPVVCVILGVGIGRVCAVLFLRLGRLSLGSLVRRRLVGFRLRLVGLAVVDVVALGLGGVELDWLRLRLGRRLGRGRGIRLGRIGLGGIGLFGRSRGRRRGAIAVALLDVGG